MHRRTGFIFMATGVLLIMAALLLLGYNRLEDARAGREAQAAMDELRRQIEARNAAEAAERARAAALASASDETIADAGAGQETPVVDTSDYIGYLTIPALGLELPVRDGWSYPKLRTAPCRYRGSVETDDLVVVGHNYSRHFGRLHRLAAGEQILFTDMEGQKTVYRVEEVANIEPTDVEEVEDGSYALTLITCTPGGKMRVAVRCSQGAVTSGQ